MGFVTSTTPDITEGLTAELSRRTTATYATQRSVKFDVTVGGIGFCIDPDGPRDGGNGPYVRQSVPVQKQQTDTSDQPGEQSLDGYWIRSQNSWHRGAGINFYEPGSEEDTAYRFSESSGMDVWTPGEISALHKMTLVQAAAGDCYVMDAGTDTVFLSDTAILGWDQGGATPPYTLNAPAAGHNGRYYFFGYENYYKVGWVSPASATVGVWNGRSNTVIAKNATVEPKLWYCKDRLIVSHGANLFEVPPDSATPVDLGATASALYAPKDPNLEWVDVVEGPSAIYAGYSSGIVRFTLEDAASGTTPDLSQAYRVLELPAGETLKAMAGYLGRFLVLSTTVGIRVVAIDGNGFLTMGQVIADADLGDFRGMSAYGDMIYLAGAYVPRHGTTGGTSIPGWDYATGLLGINLGEPLGDGSGLRFAYAMDERSTVKGTTTSSLVSGGNKFVAITGSGVWKTHADYVEGGYLAMGRVRFNTLVKKVFRSLDLLGELGSGSLRVDMYDEREASIFNVTMDSTTGVFESVSLPLDRLHSYLRPVGTFTWTAGEPPTLNLLQVRALPAPKRVRQVRYPLKCHDKDTDRNGNVFGYEADANRAGWAYDRLSDLEALEEEGLPVVIQDHRTGESFTAVIDEVQYDNQIAPDKKNSNFGGTIRLTVTKLT